MKSSNITARARRARQAATAGRCATAYAHLREIYRTKRTHSAAVDRAERVFIKRCLR